MEIFHFHKITEQEGKHKRNRGLTDEGNDEQVESRKSFWKEVTQRISQLPEWNVWWTEEQRR